MVEPGFLHPVIRRCALFFAMGAVLYVGTQYVSRDGLDARKSIEVYVPLRASEHERNRVVERAVLASYALERGALETDPLWVEHEAFGAPSEIVDDVRLRADPLLRERLALHGEQLLRARLQIPPPSDADLEAYRARHAARYRRPARVDASHVFVSDRRDEADRRARLREVAEQVAAGLLPERAAAWSDASILPRTLRDMRPADLDATFGPGFARAVDALPEGKFSGPIRSRYGTHFVYVHKKTQSAHPPLSEVRARVLADYLEDARGAHVEQAVQQLVASYDVRVVEPAP